MIGNDSFFAIFDERLYFGRKLDVFANIYILKK